MARKKQSFETALSDLEQLVTALEKGDQPLDEALSTFEKGIKLTRDCRKQLADAEQKVQILLEENGELSTQPFHDGQEDSAE